MSRSCKELYEEGNRLRKKGKLNDALEKYREAAERNCEKPWVYTRLAKAYRELWRRSDFEDSTFIDSEIEYLERGIDVIRSVHETRGDYGSHLDEMRERLEKARTYRRNRGEVNDEKGSLMYKVKKFRSRVLPALVRDLDNLSLTGIPEDENDEHCKAIQRALERVEDTIVEIEDDLDGPVQKLIGEFRKAYKEWNQIDGNDEEQVSHRRRKIKEIRDIRDRLSRAIQDHSKYADKVDNDFVKDIYRPILEVSERTGLVVHLNDTNTAAQEYGP